MKVPPEEGFEWGKADPQTQGLSSAKLEEMRCALAEQRTKTLLVIRNDRIVCEWYRDGWARDKPHYTASLAKALVGGISLMLAMDDGLICPDDLACKFIPAWRDDPLKSKITIRHLATHSSGIEEAAATESELARAKDEGIPVHELHMILPDWKGAFWRREPDPFTLSRDEAPVLFEPGSDFAYSNPGMAMLSYAVTAAIQTGRHKDIRTLLRERIMRPIGVPDDEWSVGYEQTYEVDGLPLVANWGGGEFTARAAGRVGRLMLHRGNWEGKQLISPEIVDRAVRPAGTPPFPDDGHRKGIVSGLGWWTGNPRAHSVIPRQSFCGFGAQGQLLLVIPHLQTIVVRNGPLMGDEIWDGLDRYVIKPLMEAYLPPHPPSPIIAGIGWAPTDTIRRAAWDSDTWPVTWGDDDNLYTAWADGQGFEKNQTPEKMSLGFAKIVGAPDDFVGENIRSETGEDTGNGPKGKKGSGLLMVDGVLYLWARNANRKGEQSQLAWSEDHAQTWTWSEWTFEKLGACTFLNFGRNYHGARDGYVYVYSPDHPSAYAGADGLVLLRVPKGKIRDQEAYEYYAGLSQDGSPRWSNQYEDAAPVFEYPGRCSRTSVHYNGALERYILWEQLVNGPRHSQTRFTGGFAMYDAPEPWGPWTTIYYTEHWDVGPGETAHVPTKWISKDGKDFHLVFSGEDYFSVRKGTFLLRD